MNIYLTSLINRRIFQIVSLFGKQNRGNLYLSKNRYLFVMLFDENLIFLISFSLKNRQQQAVVFYAFGKLNRGIRTNSVCSFLS
jgi:hypothetical protein